MEKQIAAAQKFLSNVTALPTFLDLRRKQCDRLVALFGKSSLSVEQSAALMTLLDRNLWDSDSLEQLKSAIAQQTSIHDDFGSAAARAALQDYTALPHYLSQDWWNLLENGKDKVRNLESLCGLAASLGCRNPTEPSYAGLCALSFCVGGMRLIEEDKLKLLALHKPRMKKVFNNALPLAEVMEALPVSPENCPREFLAAAYPNGFTAGNPVTVPMATVCNLVSTYPCRRRGRISDGQSSRVEMDSPVTKALSRFAVVAKALTNASQESKGEKTEGDDELPGFKMLKPAALSVGSNLASANPQQLALMDRQPEAVVEPATEPSTRPESSLAVVDKLKQALEQEKEKTKLPSQGGKKKPSKTLSGKESREKPVTKKPASKAKVLKKPAASIHRLKRPAAAAQTQGDAKRQKVLKLVPKEVLARFMHGCSRCYHRQYCTVSCWARRGYSL